MATDNELLLVGMNSIGGKVDSLCDGMEYVKGELIRNEEWHNTLNNSVGEIHDAVHGNGKPGLTNELKCIDNAVGEINVRLTAIENDSTNRATLSATSKLEWLRGWRAVFFTGITVTISTIVTLGLGYYFSLISINTP